MFQCDFVALGENQTRNFVAQQKLCFNATSSLFLGIELVVLATDRVRVKARAGIHRQIRHRSGTAPAQLPRFDPSLTSNAYKKLLMALELDRVPYKKSTTVPVFGSKCRR